MICLNCGNQTTQEASHCPFCGEAFAPATGEQFETSALPPVMAQAPVQGYPTTTPASDEPLLPPTWPERPAPEASAFASELPPIAASTPPPTAVRKKRSRKLPVIIGVVVLAAVLIGGGIFGFLTWQEHQRSEAYAAAVTLMDEKRYEEAITAFEALEDYQDSAQMIVRCQHFIAYGAAVELYDAQDYEEALDAFEALGSFEDSEDWCEQCRMGIVFEDASSLFEAGDIAGAREQFVILENRGFSAADGWVEKCDYLLAEALFDAGKRYDAYVAFLALGDYEDAAARAEACKVSAPSTGELWHNGSYPDGGSTIEINCANVTGYYYFKIYSGSTEVATMFINGGGSVAVDLPPGGYTIKEATGADWWGTDDLFGPRGSYSRMIYDDGSDSFYLAWNEIVTITLNVSDGNVGSQNENLESF